MSTEQQQDVEAVKPGMAVEATEGDLAEEDVSKPRVTEVKRAGGWLGRED